MISFLSGSALEGVRKMIQNTGVYSCGWNRNEMKRPIWEKIESLRAQTV